MKKLFEDFKKIWLGTLDILKKMYFIKGMSYK